MIRFLQNILISVILTALQHDSSSQQASLVLVGVNGFVHKHDSRSLSFISSSTTTRRNKATTSPFTTSLCGGVGIAKDYSWREDPLEIDITVSVPANTRAKDIIFKAKQTSIDLRLKKTTTDDNDVATADDDNNDKEKDDEIVLLDVNRKMRGRVSLDGTYWVISDKEDDRSQREITVTIEKNIRGKDDFDVVDYDWGGVYLNDEEEIISKSYEEPEELNVREYAASLGVDIDNINMSMVDKSMFSSGLNMTQQTLDQMSKAGYIQEVTQQADGSEYITDEESGDAIPYSRFGDDTSIGADEIFNADGVVGSIGSTAGVDTRPKIPFLDTPSPWNKNVPVQDVTIGNETIKAAIASVPEQESTDDYPTLSSTTTTTMTTTASETTKSPSTTNPKASSLEEENDDDDDVVVDPKNASDPIDLLTVKRLKEILREQGLKVSGNKKELQDRLRNHVQNKLKENGKGEDN